MVFPILHGPFGEDGTIQGLLKIAEVPFVGAGVLSSALVMDKEVSKRLLKEAGIPTSRFLSFTTEEKENIKFSTVVDHLGLPLFVKPANLGSSVGMSKVKKEEDFTPALEKAFRYDNKILIEEYIEGREIECAVLGNEQPRASCPGEVIPRHEFYSYEAKYVDPGPFEIPLLFPGYSRENTIPGHSGFSDFYCEGMARVDFFLRGEEILVNSSTLSLIYLYQYVSQTLGSKWLLPSAYRRADSAILSQKRKGEKITNFHKLVTNRSLKSQKNLLQCSHNLKRRFENMKKTWLLVSLVSVLVLSMALPLFAQERGQGMRPGDFGERDRVMKQYRSCQSVSDSLSLTEEQKTQALDIWTKYRSDIRDLQGQIEDARIALWKLSLEDPSNEIADEIRAKIED